MVDPQADDPGTIEPKPIRTASLHSIPLHPKPTNKEAVLSFLSRLREKVESGECPISDLIVLCLEQTEFTVKTYVMTTDGMDRMEIIGNLHAMATEITMEHS
jgi:hypothetical protein